MRLISGGNSSSAKAHKASPSRLTAVPMPTPSAVKTAAAGSVGHPPKKCRGRLILHMQADADILNDIIVKLSKWRVSMIIFKQNLHRGA